MLSVILLTHNNERLISDILESLEWCRDIIVLDIGSTDHTMEIAQTFPHVRIHQSKFSVLGTLYNELASLAANDWIFSLSPDETIPSELAEELQELTLDPACLYAVARQTFFRGKWIKHLTN